MMKRALIFIFVIGTMLSAETLTFLKPNTVKETLQERIIQKLTEMTGDKVELETIPYRRMLYLMELEGRYIGTALSKQTIDEKGLPYFGPTYFEYVFIHEHADHPIGIATVEEAKKLESLGVIKGTYLHKVLADMGFENLNLYKNARAMQRNLLLGRVRAIVPPENLFVEGGELHDPKIKSTGVMVMDNSHYVAFSKMTPEETVTKWKNAFAKFQKTREFVDLQQKSDEIVERLAESSPVLGVEKDLSVIGEKLFFINPGKIEDPIGRKIIEKLAEITGDEAEIVEFPIKRALRLMDEKANYVGLSIAKKTIDESGYPYFGPLHDEYVFMFMHEDRPVDIGNLDDAKKLKAVGVINGSFEHRFLYGQQFLNLKALKTIKLLKSNLMSGRIDAFAAPEIPFSHNGEHFDEKIQSTGVLVMDRSHYVAFSPKAPEIIVERWQEAFEEFKRTRDYIQIIEPED